MDTRSCTSPAKLNLTLRVLGKRPDGFHEIESLVVRLGLADLVQVTARNDRTFTLDVTDPSVPADERNLAWQAAARLRDACGEDTCGVDMRLVKRIPAGGGLGGGSSNAAAVLRLLNELWQLRWKAERLAALGAELGSDVPLFFHAQTCVARGRGELVEDVPRPLLGWAVVILPAIQSATAPVYAAFDRSKAATSRASVEEILATEGGVDAMMPMFFNDLETPAIEVHPALADFARKLRLVDGGRVRMTGSGSAFFRLFNAYGPAAAFGETVRGRLESRVEVVPLEMIGN